jgi:exodeoxyribonuclease VIII
MKHLMIDIETLGLDPNSFVTQIGYTVVDDADGSIVVPATNIWTDDRQPGVVNMDTVRWWMQQSEEARKTVFQPLNGVARLMPYESFAELREVVLEHDPDVWGSPAMFDLPILTYYWGGKKPWLYNRERCMMTLYRLIDRAKVLQPPPNKLAHDAASDAEWQAQYLLNLLKSLEGN